MRRKESELDSFFLKHMTVKVSVRFCEGFCMLDKSIPYKDIIMKMDHEDLARLSAPVLPPDFSFRKYRDGDAAIWSDIETSVLEFPDTQKAMEYFARDYLPFEQDLKERMIFMVNEKDVPIATAAAWWVCENERYQASLHWVSVRPEYQGMGLGKAVVLKALSLFPAYNPGEDIYLHTQTWSHIAVRLYLSLGFRMCKDDSLGKKKSDYEGALPILKSVLDMKTYDRLVETSE